MPRRPLVDVVAKLRPDVDDPVAAIEGGRVQVDGVVVLNPNSQVRTDARLVVKDARGLKGEAKLAAGLDAFDGQVAIDGQVALDVGASTGGFTTELLRRGASRVYAVDVGHGQLMGALRQNPRVVSLEQTNATDLTSHEVPEPIGVMTVDVSYSPLRALVPGVTNALAFTATATLVALVKPMFELQAATLPTDPAALREAVDRGETAIREAGWRIRETIESPLRGNGGAVEFFVHAVFASQ
jgi:23S rRNA (cytidine1920-2'-O)/16S rRNA (cytidine1409-2'-O)-methyltransferase